jgi:alcohol dehydrogenase
VQLAAQRGAEVIAVASTQEKLDRLSALGATHGVLARGAEYGAQVWELTGRRGADVIVDYTGSETWPTTIRTVRNGGRILVCGATTGYEAVTDLRYVWVRESTIIGSDGWRRSDLEALLALVAVGRLEPVIDRIVGFDGVAAAHDDLEQRRVFGKILVSPAA